MSWVFLSFWPAFIYKCFPLTEPWPLWEPGECSLPWSAWEMDLRVERPKTSTSPSSWFCFSFLHSCFEFPRAFYCHFLWFLECFGFFFFFNSILFLCNPWMNYFLTILENSPYMYGLCFIQVFFQFMLFSISRLEAFFRYLVILGSLHMFQSEDYKVEWELWAHRMGWLRMNFPVEWLTWIVWEPPVCRIFVPCPGLWQWKRWVLTSGHPGNSHLDHLIQHPGPQLHFYLSSVSPSPRIKPPDSAAAGKDLRSNLGGQTASPTPLPVPKVPSTAGCKAFWGGDRVVYMGSY